MDLAYVSPKLYALLFSRYVLLGRAMLYFRQVLEKWVCGIVLHNYTLSLEVSAPKLLPVCFFFKKHTSCLFTQVADITALDLLASRTRFRVLYQLLSISFNTRVTLVVDVGELGLVPTVTYLYPAANWLECEVWDLFGISFEGHKSLHRILTDYGFRYFPLRKDFPLSGYTELFYNEVRKAVGYYKISLAQEFRHYNFFNPWLPR